MNEVSIFFKEIKAETNKAVLVDGHEKWIPKSLIKNADKYKKTGVIIVPEWFSLKED